jgi:hypothetical protein
MVKHRAGEIFSPLYVSSGCLEIFETLFYFIYLFSHFTLGNVYFLISLGFACV